MGDCVMSGKTVPMLWSDPSECCGCSACFAVCPKSAIAMKPDQFGFLYPEIDEALCVRCGSCTKVCAFKEKLD